MALTQTNDISTFSHGVVGGVSIDGDQTLGSGHIGFVLVTANATVTLPTAAVGFGPFRIVPSKSGLKITISPPTADKILYPGLDGSSSVSANKDIIWDTEQAGRVMEISSAATNDWQVTAYDGQKSELSRQS